MAESGASGDRGADRWALRLSLAAAEGVVVIRAAGRVGVVSAPDLHHLPLPTYGHRQNFGDDPAKHRDVSAVTHVARG